MQTPLWSVLEIVDQTQLGLSCRTLNNAFQKCNVVYSALPCNAFNVTKMRIDYLYSWVPMEQLTHLTITNGDYYSAPDMHQFRKLFALREI